MRPCAVKNSAILGHIRTRREQIGLSNIYEKEDIHESNRAHTHGTRVYG